MQLSYPEIDDFPDDFMFLNDIASSKMILSWTRYAIFVDWDRQLSWQFHVFEWSCKFQNDFTSWITYIIFIRCILCIFWIPYLKKKKKKIVPIYTAYFPWSETMKIPKLSQINLRENFTTVMKWSLMDHIVPQKLHSKVYWSINNTMQLHPRDNLRSNRHQPTEAEP